MSHRLASAISRLFSSLAHLASCALLLWVVAPVRAVEYFVSTRGNDASAGAAVEQPWRSIQHGVSRLQAGDRLTILPGEYREAVVGKGLAGTAAAPITIRAQRAGTVVVRGDVEVTGWQAVEGRGGVFAVAFTEAVQGVADERTMKHFAPAPTMAELAEKPGAFLHDAAQGRLFVRTVDAQTPVMLAVSVTNGCGLALDHCAHVVVEGLAFTGFNHTDNVSLFGSRARWGFIALKCEAVTVRRCVAYVNSGGFCLMNAAGSVVEECEAFGNTSRTVGIANQILGWTAKDCFFRRNRIEGFNNPSGSQDQIAFYSNAGNANVIENNVAVRGGYMDKGDAEKVRVTGNVSTGSRPQYYRPPDASNLSVAYRDPRTVAKHFADPVNGDFRLLPEAPQRGRGLEGADPGPQPYREAVFFVSPDGSDAAPGTSPPKAWRTLKHAAARAKAGETIYIMRGKYEDSLAPSQSGEPGRPIRFVRYADDRVILEGRGRLPVAVDLTGRSQIEVDGLVLRNFARHGVLMSDASGITLENVIVGNVGSDAVSATRVSGLTIRHALVSGIDGAGVRALACSEVSLAGNLFGECQGPRLALDAASLATLWSDRNDFAPTDGARVLIEAGGKAHATLADWQQASALDARSLAADPGFRADGVADGGVALRDDSSLIGRGPRAAAIGPFHGLTAQTSTPIEAARLHSATPTTANLECRTPAAPVEVTLAWGATPALGEQRTSTASLSHTLSLTGLKPGTEYYCQFNTSARQQRVIFGTDRGTHNVVRRCFYDGRVLSGYMNVFIGVNDCPDFLIENCVMILGMGEGLSLQASPRAIVRHCVFYNNNIRALTLYGDAADAPVTLTHNLFCAVIPPKGGSAFLRVRQLRNLVSDHNGYFDRPGITTRALVEAAFIGEREVGQPKPGSYAGRKMTIDEVRSEAGLEKNSFFGNPGLAVAKQLAPKYNKDDPAKNDRNWSAAWLENDLHQSRTEIRPLDFHDFMAAADTPFGKSAAGNPIGLDPAAFGEDFARSPDRGSIRPPTVTSPR